MARIYAKCLLNVVSILILFILIAVFTSLFPYESPHCLKGNHSHLGSGEDTGDFIDMMNNHFENVDEGLRENGQNDLDMQKRMNKNAIQISVLSRHASQHRHQLTHIKSMITDLPTTTFIGSQHWLKECDDKFVNKVFTQKASVIITFHDNEELSVLLHTIHSILQRTPPSLLKEIILIDDATKKDEFKDILEHYISTVFNSSVVSLYRSKVQLGLIKARLLGAKLSSAEIIVSMDSHMEVQKYWLEALLDELEANPKALVASYLDWFGPDNTTEGKLWWYKRGPRRWQTFFEWSFDFGYMSVNPKHWYMVDGDQTAAIPTAVIAGTIWAMDRDFFFHVGGLDDGMDGWGGENIDLAIRVWLFGGRVLSIPCSQAAHRKGSISYRNQENWIAMENKNCKRLVEVWFDDYKKWANLYNPALQFIDIEEKDIAERKKLKKKATHDISWFFDNIQPYLNIPDRDSLSWGDAEHLGTNKCMFSAYKPRPQPPVMRPCHRSSVTQNFMWNRNGELRFPMWIFTETRTGPLTPQPIIPNFNNPTNTRWIHWKDGPIMLFNKRLCLEATPKDDITLVTCRPNYKNQKWRFRYYTDHYWNATGDIQQGLSDPSSQIRKYITRFLESKENDMFYFRGVK